VIEGDRQSPGGRRGGRRTVDKAVDEAAAEQSTRWSPNGRRAVDETRCFVATRTL